MCEPGGQHHATRPTRCEALQPSSRIRNASFHSSEAQQVRCCVLELRGNKIIVQVTRWRLARNGLCNTCSSAALHDAVMRAAMVVCARARTACCEGVQRVGAAAAAASATWTRSTTAIATEHTRDGNSKRNAHTSLVLQVLVGESDASGVRVAVAAAILQAAVA